YDPAQILVEYNGMWDMDVLFDSGMPEDWFVGGVYSTVNADTAELYIQNMRKVFLDPLRESNLIIVNRCDEDTDRQRYRRLFKMMNPQVQVAFEKKDGTLFGNEKEDVPYDYSGDRIELDDMDYGLWYLDAQENPDRYIGKVISFTARYCASAKPGEKYFIPGRHIMTCCEDDIEFLGFLCNCVEVPDYEHGEWVRVDVYFDYGECEMYGPGEEGPVLELLKIEDGKQPEQELVAFT
ncbi:MAG: hypothetical protein J6M22_00305, partial [Firmicutes bacterium]|nr:hypothetical protein [Bacillota bacterium]